MGDTGKLMGRSTQAFFTCDHVLCHQFVGLPPIISSQPPRRASLRQPCPRLEPSVLQRISPERW